MHELFSFPAPRNKQMKVGKTWKFELEGIAPMAHNSGQCKQALGFASKRLSRATQWWGCHRTLRPRCSTVVKRLARSPHLSSKRWRDEVHGVTRQHWAGLAPSLCPFLERWRGKASPDTLLSDGERQEVESLGLTLWWMSQWHPSMSGLTW